MTIGMRSARETRFTGLWHLQARIAIFAQLVAQRADRNAEDVGGVRAVAQTMIERIQNEIALDIGDRTSNEAARCGLRGFDGGFHRPGEIARGASHLRAVW